jgi:hypothetical protein
VTVVDAFASWGAVGSPTYPSESQKVRIVLVPAAIVLALVRLGRISFRVPNVSRNRPQTLHWLGCDDEAREPLGIGLGDVVDVDHRRLDVRMSHERLHVRERERLDGQRAERVPEVVQAELPQFGPVERAVEAAAELPIVQVAADLIDENEVVVAGEPVAAAGSSSALAAWSISVADLTRPPFDARPVDALVEVSGSAYFVFSAASAAP